MSTLAERIKRNNMEDQIYIGQLIEKSTSGEFGQLLKLIINGIHDDQLLLTNISSDRIVGRLESLKIFQDRLILAIDIKNSLVEDLKKSERVGAETD